VTGAAPPLDAPRALAEEAGKEDDDMPKLAALVLVPVAILAFARPSQAAMARTYQVTGPVVSVTPDTITVKKGKDNWEIGRDSSTKTAADPKVGDKVTVQYRMTAASIETAGAKAPAKKP
jgi:hypothetical protein